MAAYDALTSLSESTELLLHKINLRKATDDDRIRFSRILLLQQLEIEIISLRKNIDFMRSVLEESPAHPFEAQMKDSAEEARVVIERFVLDQLRPELPMDGDVIFESLSHQLRGIHDDLISSAVDKINNNASDETDEESVGIFDSSLSRKVPLTSGHVIVGMDAMLEDLKLYVSDESSAELRLVSILGMGGTGKTTLARMLYNETSEEFEVIGWVTVSKDFSARDLLVSLMASIRPFIKHPKQRDESMENHIHKNLKGRRFLIVLDDLWSPEALFLLMTTFPDDGNKSRVLITTRTKEVAVAANPKPKGTFHMYLMKPSDSDLLLRLKVFHPEKCPGELEDLLCEIAMECRGLPLAVVLVAGILLASNKSFHEWNYVFQKINGISDNYGQDKMVATLLSLSYKHLPHRLRSCLLYMGAFREDHQINVARLVKKWSAQGFLHKSTSREVEQCVHYLVNRNLVSVLEWKSDGEIKCVSLHDMVRDFCLAKAQVEKFLRCATDRDLRESKIKVSFNSDDLQHICNSDEEADDLTHTIMCFGKGRTRSGTLDSIGRFRLLKSLDLANVEIESFPNEVLNLFLLRLLALGHVPELPPSISNLRYLETLIVNDAKDIPSSSSIITLPRMLCLPFEIWSISGLRHIVSFCCGAFPSPSKEENSPLENLETLSAVMNLDCSEDLIGMIPNVKKLGIFYFGVKRATHSIENIERMGRLEKLKVWVMVPFSAPQNLDLGFPTTLRKLTLRGIRLSHRDTTIIGQLPRLQVLKLRRIIFEGDEWRVTTAHGFEMLEYLLLEELGLRHWFLDGNDGEGFVFPMLKKLIVRTCNELNEIDKVIHSIPSLEEITVGGCRNKSLVESVRRIKQSDEKLTVRIRNYG